MTEASAVTVLMWVFSCCGGLFMILLAITIGGFDGPEGRP